MLQKIVKLLETLTQDELFKLKDIIDQHIRSEFVGDSGKKRDKRIKVNIAATCLVEREKEFFVKEHKIAIVEMSLQGIVFRTSTIVYKNDILNIMFRSPTTGESKNINCQALRVKELANKERFKFEVAAKAVDEKVVKVYRDMLNKRGS